MPVVRDTVAHAGFKITKVAKKTKFSYISTEFSSMGCIHPEFIWIER